MAVDPLAGSPESPQSLNRYTYALNNPIEFTDPNGLAANGGMYGGGGSVGDALGDQPWGFNLSDNHVGAEAGHDGARDAIADRRSLAHLMNRVDKEHLRANRARREAIAAAAESHDGDTSMPYTPGHPTCNLFVQKAIAEAGAPTPLVTKADGSSGAPGAAEWAGSPVPGWRFLKPGETPERGDVAAYKITGCTWGGGPCTGHSGVVVGVSRDGFVTAIAAHEKVIGPDYSFQPSEATYRRYTGD